MENNTIKKTHFFLSLRKEKMWLEEMAMQGYFFENISSSGVTYTFRIDKPKKMIYEIDRFNLPKSPTQKDINHRGEFLAIAEELGWQEVTHDIDMNYYFAKEYEENGINELYNDEEMRAAHAAKFADHFHTVARSLNNIALFFDILMLLCALANSDHQKFYFVFGLGYSIFAFAYNILTNRLAAMYQRELSMTAEQWLASTNKGSNLKTSHRLFFSSKKLEAFLEAQSQLGWHLTKMTTFCYYFKKGEPRTVHYIIDSHTSVNKRLKMAHLQKLEDAKDISMQNNDWQYQSAEDAENKGWTFLCASGNLLIVYSRNDEPDEVENMCTTRFCLHPWSTFYIACFLVGFACSFAILFFL